MQRVQSIQRPELETNSVWFIWKVNWNSAIIHVLCLVMVLCMMSDMLPEEACLINLESL
jgi:hypothetical protein